LALDYGAKTVGVAVSDELGILASPVGVIRRENETDVKRTIARIGEYVNEYGVNTIVLGFPKNADNGIGTRAEKTLEFKRRLERAMPEANVALFDERFTTRAVERVMLEADLSRKKRRNASDKLAAAKILQDYLEHENNIQTEKRKNALSEQNDLDILEGEAEFETIVMTDDEGNETEFVIIDEITDNGAAYLLVVEAEEAGNEESDAVIFKEVSEDGENFIFEEIDDDEEFERVAALFGERGGEEYELGE
jgi:putative Holliday junction resolvase